MAWTYTNRKGVCYHLYQSADKQGKVRYACKRLATDEALDALPDGFEVNETPNGQVSVRRIQPQRITDEELATVRHAADAAGLGPVAMVERKGRAIVVHQADVGQLPPVFAALCLPRRESDCKPC